MARSSSSLLVAGGAILAALVLATLVPAASAGAVYEIKKPILPNGNDYKIILNQTAPFPPGTPGSITRSRNPFAGSNSTATVIPFSKLSLNKCAVLSFHFHPLGSEQLFILKGKVEVGMFFEDMQLRQATVNAGEGVVIPQGTVHYVRNLASETSEALQIFDHPLAGAQFVGPALFKMPADLVASAFKGPLPSNTTGNIFTVKNCCY